MHELAGGQRGVDAYYEYVGVEPVYIAAEYRQARTAQSHAQPVGKRLRQPLGVMVQHMYYLLTAEVGPAPVGWRHVGQRLLNVPLPYAEGIVGRLHILQPDHAVQHL